MTQEIKHLQLPLDPEVAAQLELGQMVTVTGRMFTGRSRFHIRAAEDNVFPPIDYGQINCFFHVGPVMQRTEDGWTVVTAEPTSSIRFERYGADIVRKFGLRTLMGKTTMGPRTAAALRETGGVYLSKIGLCGNKLAEQVKCVEEVHFLDELGKTEATWVFDVEQFGPFFVAIDTQGRSYFEDLDREAARRQKMVEEKLGISPEFDFTSVNPEDDPCA